MKKKLVRSHRFHYKMLVTNMIIVSTVIFLLFSVFIGYFIHFQNRQRIINTQNMCKSIGNQLDNSFMMINQIALQISTNIYIQEMFQTRSKDVNRANYYKDNPGEAIKANEFIWAYILNTDTASRIVLYNEQGDFICTGQQTVSEREREYISQKSMLELKNQFQEKNEPYLFRYYKKDVLNSKNTSSLNEGYLCAIRQISSKSMKNNMPIGYVEVQLSLASIKKSLGNSLTNQVLIIKDSNNDIVCTVGKYPEHESAVVNKVQISVDMKLKEDGFFIELLDYSLFNKNFALGIAALMGALILILIVVLYMIEKKVLTQLTRPLITLCEQVKMYDWDKWKEIGDLEQDEFGELQVAFRKMINELHESMVELVLVRTSKIRAQMLALQAQLDPHFIHNTLAVIIALAQSNDYEKVEEVSKRLSDMIRYGSDYTASIIPIEIEIEQVSNYLELIKARYEDDFSFQIKTFESDIEFSVPKFIIQPIIENAIQHSLKKTVFPWKIEISCSTNYDKWSIEIADNGGGIEKDKIEEIYKRVEIMKAEDVECLLEQLQIGGHSLLNTTTRLYTTYQESMIFKIANNEMGGTTVVIGGRLY